MASGVTLSPEHASQTENHTTSLASTADYFTSFLTSTTNSTHLQDGHEGDPSSPTLPPELSKSLELQRTEAVVVVILLCCVGASALLLNLFVFLATRFVVHDRNSTVVVIANTCVADAMAGMFAVSKTVFLYMNPMWVNCFLWESILFTSILMSSILTPCLMWDSLNLLHHASLYSIGAGKRRMIISMVFLWDGAVVIGFIPLMGWNRWEDVHLDDRHLRTCHFFLYYQIDYLTVLCSLLLAGLFFSICLLGALVLRRRQFKANLQAEDNIAGTVQLQQFTQAIVTCAYVSFCQVICFLPFVSFVLVNCRTLSVPNDIALTYMLIALLSKSFVSPLILGHRIPQVKSVLKGLWSFELQSSFLCCVLDETEEQLRRRTTRQTRVSVIENNNSPTANGGQQHAYPSVRSCYAGTVMQQEEGVNARVNGRLRFNTLPSASRTPYQRHNNAVAYTNTTARGSPATWAVSQNSQTDDQGDNAVKLGHINPAFSCQSLNTLATSQENRQQGNGRSNLPETASEGHVATNGGVAGRVNGNIPQRLEVPHPLMINPSCQIHGRKKQKDDS